MTLWLSPPITPWAFMWGLSFAIYCSLKLITLIFARASNPDICNHHPTTRVLTHATSTPACEFVRQFEAGLSW